MDVRWSVADRSRFEAAATVSATPAVATSLITLEVTMSFSLWRSSPLFAALIIALLVALMAPAAGQEPTEQTTVDPPATDLSVVATTNGFTEDELIELLDSDPSLAVDTNGELLYLDPRPTTDDADPGSTSDPDPDPDAGAGDPAGSDEDETPSLSVLESVQLDEDLTLASLPGARHTIVLDIDGHVTTDTSWNARDDGPAIISGPFDLDDDPSSWSDAEREAIRTAWAIVAEDFAPWAVNVTTAEPEDPSDLTYEGDGDARWGVRIVLSPDDWMDCGCAAATYLGSFTDRADEPAFVHLTDAAPMGEAASHAVGHALGLVHDGGDDGAPRYPGHESLGGPDWAPIMGAPSGSAISQWSSQGYVGGRDNGQDDLAIIASPTGGLELRPDDHGDATDPTPLNGAGPEVDGIIGTSTDVDAFSFTTTGGVVSLSVSGQPLGSNLDASLTLIDSAGEEIAVDDPAELLSASIEVDLPAGEYTAIVDGVRVGLPFLDPPTGYGDAGSLGRYTLTGTIAGAAPADIESPEAPDGVIGIGIEQLVVLGWAPVADDDVDQYLVLRAANAGGAGVEVATVAGDQNGYEDLMPRVGVSFYTVVAVDRVGNRSAPSSEVQVIVEPAIGTFPDPDPQPELDPEDEPDSEVDGGEPTTDEPDVDADEPETDEDGDEADDEDGDETDEPGDETDEPGDETDEPGDESDVDEDEEELEADDPTDELVESEEEPERETFVYGAITGDVDAIAEADGRGQWVTENLSGGAERARHDRLEHRWVVPAATGNQQLHVVAEAGDDAGDADDGFILAWSTDRVEWTTLATILPGEILDESFDIGAPVDDVHVRVQDTDRTPRQQSPDSIFVDLILVLGDGQEPEPEPEPTEVVAEIDHHFQGIGEGERAVVVTALVVDDLDQPVVGVSVEVEVMGDIAETVTLTTGADGRGEEQTEAAALRPEIEICLVDVDADGLIWQPGQEHCPSEDRNDDEPDQDQDQADSEAEDEVQDEGDETTGDTAGEEPAGGEAAGEPAGGEAAEEADPTDADPEEADPADADAEDAEPEGRDPEDDPGVAGIQ